MYHTWHIGLCHKHKSVSSHYLYTPYGIKQLYKEQGSVHEKVDDLTLNLVKTHILNFGLQKIKFKGFAYDIITEMYFAGVACAKMRLHQISILQVTALHISKLKDSDYNLIIHLWDGSLDKMECKINQGNKNWYTLVMCVCD